MKKRTKYHGMYYKIQSLGIFNNIEGKYEGYIHMLKLTDYNAYGELIVNGDYHKTGWISKSCLGERITREEWNRAYKSIPKEEIIVIDL